MNDSSLRKIVAVLAAAVLAAACGGCVSAGRVDPTVVNRYQQSLVQRGTQPRGIAGLEPYIPAPAMEFPWLAVELDEDSGRHYIQLTLDEAVRRALANSMEIHVVAYDPAIAREEIVQAAAEFDFLLIGRGQLEWQRQRADLLSAPSEIERRSGRIELRQRTITGAEWALSYSTSRVWDNQSFRQFATRYDRALQLELAQPLLRNAWPRVNLARLRIARLNRNSSEEQFRQRVEEVVTEVITTYWQLIQARQDLEIQRRLLENTIFTRDRIEARIGIDATNVELAQSRAAVAIRRAGLIFAEKIVWDVQDRLLRLLGDRQLNALSGYEIIPVTEPMREAVEVDVADQLMTALEYNPVLEQARIGLAVADINVDVARNQTLPRLDFTTAGGLTGAQRPSPGSAQRDLWSFNYWNFSVGLIFEYPLGNRAPEAQLRQRRLERIRGMAQLQNIADQLAVVVNERIRQIATSFEEMAAQVAAVEAAEIQLQALRAREEIRGQLSPAFLQTMLSAQETLAEAQRGLLRAVINYNVAQIELARTTGTVLQVQGVSLALPPAVNDRYSDRPASNGLVPPPQDPETPIDVDAAPPADTDAAPAETAPPADANTAQPTAPNP